MEQDFYQIIDFAVNKIPNNQNLAHAFLSDAKNISRFVLGKNDDSETLIKNFKINGVVDDFSLLNSKME